MNIKKLGIGAASFAVVGVLGLGAASFANADDTPTPTSTSKATATAGEPSKQGKQGPPGNGGGRGHGAGRGHVDATADEAGKATAALQGPKPSSRAAELSAQARAAMAETPANVTPPPAAKTHATPLEGLTAGDKYALWRDYEALLQANGGDVEVLAEAWQRRFYVGFPNSSIFRAQATLASAQKETRGG